MRKANQAACAPGTPPLHLVRAFRMTPIVTAPAIAPKSLRISHSILLRTDFMINVMKEQCAVGSRRYFGGEHADDDSSQSQAPCRAFRTAAWMHSL